MEFKIPNVKLTELKQLEGKLPKGIILEELEPIYEEKLQLWLNNEALIGVVENMRFVEGVFYGDLHFFLNIEAAFTIAPGEVTLQQINIRFEEAG